MRHYFIDISTAESGRVWQEVDIRYTSHTAIKKEFGRDTLYYDGKRVYEGNPNDRYFRSIFTGEIRWLPAKRIKTREQICKQCFHLLMEVREWEFAKIVELEDNTWNNPCVREAKRRRDKINGIAISLLIRYGYMEKRPKANKH